MRRAVLLMIGCAVLPGIASAQTPSSHLKAVHRGHLTCLLGLIDDHGHLTDQTSPSSYVDKFHWNLADYVVRSPV